MVVFDTFLNYTLNKKVKKKKLLHWRAMEKTQARDQHELYICKFKDVNIYILTIPLAHEAV